jgi:hypothetical protein
MTALMFSFKALNFCKKKGQPILTAPADTAQLRGLWPTDWRIISENCWRCFPN